MTFVKPTWNKPTQEIPSSNDARAETIEVVGLWYDVLFAVERWNVGIPSVLPSSTIRYAWRHKFGDFSCECLEFECDRLAGHDNWDGTKHYRGLYF